MDAEIRLDSVALEGGGTMLVATPVGDLDLSNADSFKAQLLRALARVPRLLVVDLSQTTFIDSTILNALVAIHRRAGLIGSGFCLTNIGPRVAKPFTITRLDTYLTCYPTVEAAASTLTANGTAASEGRRPRHHLARLFTRKA